MKRRRTLAPEADEIDLGTSGLGNLIEESCLNPWNGRCASRDIALYIVYKGSRVPICRRCWMSISSQDIEWTCD